MKKEEGSQRRVDATMEGATVEVHGVMVTPAARVRGAADARREERGAWRYAWARIQPAGAIVRDPSGQTSELKLAPTERQVLGAMAAVGLVVAVVTVTISALTRKQL